MGLQFVGLPRWQRRSYEPSQTCRVLAEKADKELRSWRPLNARTSTLLKLWFVMGFTSVMAVATAHGDDTAAKTTRAALKPDQIAKARKSILKYTNRERVQRGLPPLKSSAALDYLAQSQSANMCAALRSVDSTRARNKCSLPNFNHESELFPTGWQAFGERLKKADVNSGAENIACRTLEQDLDKWAKGIVRGWMLSKLGHHKKNILSRKHRFLGVGVVGCIERIGYATQVFSGQTGRIRQDLSSRYTGRARGGTGRGIAQRHGASKQ